MNAVSDTPKLVGTHPERVLELLRQRQSSSPLIPDGRKLGLVVEGGGMRGVLSAGSLLAIDLLGFRDCFDVIYAVSAGSVNAAYFLSGQGIEGITIYFDDISSRRFINPWRLWKIVDVDFVYDYLVPHVKSLNEESILKATQEFYVAATDVDTGDNVLLDTRTGEASIARFLKASSALPVLYNRRVTIGNKHYMDGGASGGLPIDYAIKQGCTDLLILLSRQADYISKRPSLFDRTIFRILVGYRYPAMYHSFLNAVVHKERNRQLANGAVQSAGVNVATVCPDAEENSVSRTTTDRSVLIRGAYLLARKVYQIFGEETSPVDRLFDTFR